MVREDFYNIALNNPIELLRPAGRGARLLDLDLGGYNFDAGPGLVHRAVGRLHLFQDIGRPFIRPGARR